MITFTVVYNEQGEPIGVGRDFAAAYRDAGLYTSQQRIEAGVTHFTFRASELPPNPQPARAGR